MHGLLYFLFALVLGLALSGCNEEIVEEQTCFPNSLLERVEVRMSPKDKTVESSQSETLPAGTLTGPIV